MSEYGLQGTPKDVLSFFHPTQRRRPLPKKLVNQHARNYTLKLLLSLIVTMHYAAVRNCRKRAFHGLPKRWQDRLGVAPPGRAPRPSPFSSEAVTVLSKGLRNHSSRPCSRATRSNEFEALPAQRGSVQVRCSAVPYNRCELYESRFPDSQVVRSMARLDFPSLPGGPHALMNTGECGSSV